MWTKSHYSAQNAIEKRQGISQLNDSRLFWSLAIFRKWVALGVWMSNSWSANSGHFLILQKKRAWAVCFRTLFYEKRMQIFTAFCCFYTALTFINVNNACSTLRAGFFLPFPISMMILLVKYIFVINNISDKLLSRYQNPEKHITNQPDKYQNHSHHKNIYHPQIDTIRNI